MKRGRKSPVQTKNKEYSSQFFEFDLRIVKFCPKSANFAQNQGINSEFCGFLPKPWSPRNLPPILRGFKKTTVIYRELLRELFRILKLEARAVSCGKRKTKRRRVLLFVSFVVSPPANCRSRTAPIYLRFAYSKHFQPGVHC